MGGHVLSRPLLAIEAGYVRWLVERGYRPGAVADRLGRFRALSRWLGTHRLPVADLDPGGGAVFHDGLEVISSPQATHVRYASAADARPVELG